MSDKSDTIDVGNDGEVAYVELTDSQGNVIIYEVVATVDYNGSEYAVLLPEPVEDADEYTILQVSRDSSGEVAEYRGVPTYDELTAIYKKFVDENEG